jgi:pilus assembly protein CpaF
MSSLDRILPFLRPIEDLLRDPQITEVMVNAGGARVFVERSGLIEFVPDRVLEPRNLTVAIKNIARACGDEISETQPLLAVAGPALTIRKFTRRYDLDDLVAVGALTPAVAAQLTNAVAAQNNILIAGGTGTGKTTLLNALAARIPDDDRVGEVRGAEAFDLLQALNTGHLGSLTTIHANSAEQALTRLAHCVLTASVGLPHRSVREAIALAIHLVVHIARVNGVRRVTEVARVAGYEAASDRFVLDTVARLDLLEGGVAA